MLRKSVKISTFASLLSIAGVCLFPLGNTLQYLPFSAFDAFALEYLPNAISFSRESNHQEAIRISSSLVLFWSIALALMLAFLARNGLTLKEALRNGGQRISWWPILVVAGLLAALPFIPLLDPESMASVRLIAEGIRSSRLLLLLYSYLSFGGYLVVWFLVFHSLTSIFRRS